MQARPTCELEESAGREFSSLLRGEFAGMAAWSRGSGRSFHHIVCIIFGSGCYGAAMGWWHSPAQALYVAVKFPLIILLTAAGNALINGMLAPLLGLNISFRRSWLAVLMSYTVTSAVLAAFSPVVLFLVWNAPPNLGPATSRSAYDTILLVHVAVIAVAGSAGNARLWQALAGCDGGGPAARRVFCAWMTANLFLGSQWSWILRPFIGSPGLPVEFVRPDALRGNFYETVWHALHHLISIQ